MVYELLKYFIVLVFLFVWMEIGFLRFKSKKLHGRFVQLVGVHPIVGMITYTVCLVLWFLPVSWHRSLSNDTIATKINNA